jgi:hypothetical protein
MGGEDAGEGKGRRTGEGMGGREEQGRNKGR